MAGFWTSAFSVIHAYIHLLLPRLIQALSYIVWERKTGWPAIKKHPKRVIVNN